MLDILRRRGYKADDPDIREYSKKYYDSQPKYDSAAKLGAELGLSSQETNYLLHKKGYLVAEPSDWRPTEKGAEFSKYKGDNYPYLGWDTAKIKDDLTLTPEEKHLLRVEFKEYREQRKEKNKAFPIDVDNNLPDIQSEGSLNDEETNPVLAVLVVAGVVAGVAAACYGIYKGGKALWKWGNKKINERKERKLLERKLAEADSITPEESAPVPNENSYHLNSESD